MLCFTNIHLIRSPASEHRGQITKEEGVPLSLLPAAKVQRAVSFSNSQPREQAGCPELNLKEGRSRKGRKIAFVKHPFLYALSH